MFLLISLLFRLLKPVIFLVLPTLTPEGKLLDFQLKQKQTLIKKCYF